MVLVPEELVDVAVVLVVVEALVGDSRTGAGVRATCNAMLPQLGDVPV